MYCPVQFYQCLRGASVNVNFFAGVPDSLLKAFCSVLSHDCDQSSHVITANEGAAISLVTGHHLATSTSTMSNLASPSSSVSTAPLGLVYLQNSGLGNAVNPLLSLASPDCYAIPMLLLVGWRGEPGKKDEPQHVAQGRQQNELLEALQVPKYYLPPQSTARIGGGGGGDADEVVEILEAAAAHSRRESRPVCLVVSKGFFKPFSSPSEASESLSPPLPFREAIAELILSRLPSSAAVVSTTGHLSREVFEIRERSHEKDHSRDFLTVGSMGHANHIALGISMAQPRRLVACFDGDGALLMHMGSMAIIAQQKCNRYYHFLFNNGAHDSVGGQPTVAKELDLPAIALAVGYSTARRISSLEELDQFLVEQDRNEWSLNSDKGSVFVEILVKKGARKDLGRPTRSPVENKNDFIEFLSS